MRTLLHLFIPHCENDYLPHFFRGSSVTVIGLVVLFTFVFSSIQSRLLVDSDLLAAIFPRVLSDLANAGRKTAGVPLLTQSPLLEAAAQRKANDMATKGYFAHTSPEGITPWHWFREVGYRYRYAGENLAINFSDSQDVSAAWMRSASHRANILNGRFTEIGIATAKGTYNGRETTFVVELFGSPASGLVAEGPRILGSRSSVLAKPQSLLLRVASAPRFFSASLYLSFAVLIAAALMLMIFIEVRRQHPRHIFYGLLLLVLIGGAFTAQGVYIFSPVIIL